MGEESEVLLCYCQVEIEAKVPHLDSIGTWGMIVCLSSLLLDRDGGSYIFPAGLHCQHCGLISLFLDDAKSPDSPLGFFRHYSSRKGEGTHYCQVVGPSPGSPLDLHWCECVWVTVFYVVFG